MWNAGREFAQFQDQLNHLFGAMATGKRPTEETKDYGRADWRPATDVFETADAVSIMLDVPGIRRDQLEVNIVEDRLIISGERTAPEKTEGQRRGERRYGRFARSFQLPTEIDREQIAADYKDGVLALRLPKRTTAQLAQRIEVNVG